MNKEEYIKYVQNNEELSRMVEIGSNINAIVRILVDKCICTGEEFRELKQKYEKKMLDDSYARENAKDLEAVKTINDFMKMFGMGD